MRLCVIVYIVKWQKRKTKTPNKYGSLKIE